MAARPGPAPAAPPGVDAEALAAAMLEDVVEVLSALAGVTPVLLVAGGEDPGWRHRLAGLTWPGSVVVDVDPAAGAGEAGGGLAAGLAALGDPRLAAAAPGVTEALVVAPDAPDLPGLLLGKLYQGLGRAEVSACPGADGSLVALGARLPVPAWLGAETVRPDSPGALARLVAAAPRRGAVHLGPGWHRLRRPADLAELDEGLEGWWATRAVLAGR